MGTPITVIDSEQLLFSLAPLCVVLQDREEVYVVHEKAGKSYLQGTCSERLVLEFTIANLLSLSLERQHDQWCEQDHRRSGECS